MTCHGTRWTSLGAHWSKKQSTVDKSWDRNPKCLVLRMEISLPSGFQPQCSESETPLETTEKSQILECLAALVKHSSTWILSIVPSSWLQSASATTLMARTCSTPDNVEFQAFYMFRTTAFPSVGVQLLPFNHVFLLKANIYIYIVPSWCNPPAIVCFSRFNSYFLWRLAHNHYIILFN